LEKKVQQFVERRFNSTYCEQRRCVPTEKFDREVKGRRKLSSSQRRGLVMALIVQEGVAITTYGVRYKNDYYWGDCITEAMIGMKVNLHAMPGRPLSLRLSAYTDGRVDVDDCTYIGVVSVTEDEHPAPSLEEQRRMESRFRQKLRDKEASTTPPSSKPVAVEARRTADELESGFQPKALLAQPALSPEDTSSPVKSVEQFEVRPAVEDTGPAAAAEEDWSISTDDAKPRKRLRKSWEVE
jgi:hypothetical protein